MAARLSPILGDLGGSRIRLCERGGTSLDLGKVWDRKVDPFTGDARLSKALRTFFDEEGIDPKERELRLSLASDIYDDDFTFMNLSREWDFNRHELADEFGFSSVRVWNDAEAALYSVFDFFAAPVNGPQHYEVVCPGDSRQQGRFVLLGPGSGLGAAGAYLEQRDDEYFWVPVPSEFGQSSGWWKGEELKAVIKDMRHEDSSRHKVILKMMLGLEEFPYEYLHKREFLMSGPGIMRIYHSLNQTDLKSTADITQPEAIVRRALEDRDRDSTYVQTLTLFCRAFARTVVDFGLSFTARAGIFLTGSLLNAIGTEGLQRFGFNDALTEGRSKGGYPDNVPIYLITHKYPELVGIARFSLAK